MFSLPNNLKVFLIVSTWYIYRYGVPHILWRSLYKIDRFLGYFIGYFLYNFNKVMAFYHSEDEDETEKNKLLPHNDTVEESPEVKFEKKYLAEVRKMNNCWDWKAFEVEEQMNLEEKLYLESKEKLDTKVAIIRENIQKIEKEEADDDKRDVTIQYENEEEEEVVYTVTYEERKNSRENKLELLNKSLSQLLDIINSEEEDKKLLQEALDKSMEHIINKRIDKLQNCFVMEMTPIGNVLMIYNKERESFSYYSDASIPYRYLEPVARKYVKSFNCRPLYVDMEEELKMLEEKWEREQEMKNMKAEEDQAKQVEPIQNNDSDIINNEPKKKNVFAKLKSYNKDAGGKISMAAPPKNSIPNNKVVSEAKENEKILLKERANRYTYEGKFANFKFLKKVERKVFNKRLGLSFAEFKATFGKSGAK